MKFIRTHDALKEVKHPILHGGSLQLECKALKGFKYSLELIKDTKTLPLNVKISRKEN